MENLPIEKSPEIIQKIPAPLIKQVSDCNTPSPDQKRPQGSPNSINSGNDLKTTSTPDRLKVPKAFKYSERYKSPTDMMMSPATKGIFAITRKGGPLLPPSKNQLKDSNLQEVGLFQKYEV